MIPTHNKDEVCDVLEIDIDEDDITMQFPEEVIEGTELVCSACIKIMCDFLSVSKEEFLVGLDSPMGINEYRSDN